MLSFFFTLTNIFTIIDFLFWVLNAYVLINLSQYLANSGLAKKMAAVKGKDEM